MIIRVVKMTFQPDKVSAFLTLFEERKALIRHFSGCRHLALWQDVQDETVFFTYSHWDSEADLNNYRNAELFRDTWQRTKVLFAERASAWSVSQKMVAD